MNRSMAEICWPLEKIEYALNAFSNHTETEKFHPAIIRNDSNTSLEFSNKLEKLSDQLNIDFDEISISLGNLSSLFHQPSPLIVKIKFATEDRFLLIERGGRQKSRVFTPRCKIVSISNEEICAHLRASFEKPLSSQFEELVKKARIPASKQQQTASALLAEKLSTYRMAGIWLIRIPSSRPFFQQVIANGLRRNLLGVFIAYFANTLFFIAGWWVIGKSALAGQTNEAWLIAWILFVAGQVPLQLASIWHQRQFSIGVGRLLKKRLLFGVLNLDSSRMKNAGSGRLFSRVIDSETVESAALQGGFLSLLGLIELGFALLILKSGAGGFLHVVVLVVFVVSYAWFVQRQFKQRTNWTRSRLHITENLVEKLVGHRTRLAQEPLTKWHESEDALLQDYEHQSNRMDSTMAVINGLLGRLWLITGILALFPAIYAQTSNSPEIAISLGGILLAYGAFHKFQTGLRSLSTAHIAWNNIGTIFRQGRKHRIRLSDENIKTSNDSGPLIHCRNLSFRYPDQDDPALQKCHFDIWPGDRILLQGTSGSGKTTLLSMITALREDYTGVLLLNGVDLSTLGEQGWRRQVACAPQYYENHVLTESFAFNLLMGSQWPPSQAKLDEAMQVCNELGLGELINRMPGGLMQMVGETGWQLSHGEKSRLFIARALLQNSKLVILDESFAALDPTNMKKAFECVLNRTETLLLVAHP